MAIIILLIASHARSMAEAFVAYNTNPVSSSRRTAFAFSNRPVPQLICLRTSGTEAAAARADTWSCTAEHTFADATSSTSGVSFPDKDVQQSPRLWMEEQIAETAKGSARGGAYTVIRCELSGTSDMDRDEERNRWKIWGQGFHLGRLQNSFMLKYYATDTRPDMIESLQTAAKESIELMTGILDQAEIVLGGESDGDGTKETEQVVMLTILWTEEVDTCDINGQKRISVRAHGSIANVPSPHLKILSQSIKVAVALPQCITSSADCENGEMTQQRELDWESLPSRHDNFPQVKDSAWCKERRPLEESFKVDGVGEVILARELADKVNAAIGAAQFEEIELLEGLTSNLFVVYNDGTIRTAASGSVLHGYSRSLVLKAAKQIGLDYIEDQPVMLQDAIDGKWAEVFITSGIRLLVFVESVVVPEYSEDESDSGEITSRTFRKIWAAADAAARTESFAARIYEEILQN